MFRGGDEIFLGGHREVPIIVIKIEFYRCPYVVKMAEQTFSREYLQGLPEEIKRNTINNVINCIVSEVKRSAIRGETSYIVEKIRITNLLKPSLSNLVKFPSSNPSNPSSNLSLNISINDIITEMQKKFPDCIVLYEETWVNVTPTNRVLTERILIDWS